MMSHFIFPFQEVDKGSQIILYGAGNVGTDFYNQLVTTGYCEVIAWVDQNFAWFQQVGLPVSSSELIDKVQYEKIIIAVEYRKSAENIKRNLKQLGIEGQKIVWSENYCLSDVACYYNRKKELLPQLNGVLEEVEPKNLLHPERLDLVLRYLYAKELVDHKGKNQYEEMYKQFVLKMNGGREPLEDNIISFFSEYEKKEGIETFVSDFKKLIHSMQEKGFEKEHYIPVDKDSYLINGAHRWAAAAALGKKIWIKRFETLAYKNHLFSKEWFLKNYFEQEKIKVIEDEYRKLIGGNII